MKYSNPEEHRLRLPDGGELVYYAVGRGLPVLLANGLAGPSEVWRELIAHLSDRYRFFYWTYRGLERAPGEEVACPDVAGHALDACAILDAEGVARASVVGWSMGVNVGLELFRRAPGRVASLVLISGGARAAWADGGAEGLSSKILAKTLRLLRRAPRMLELAVRGGVHSPEVFAWARRVGFVGHRVDAETFGRITRGFARIDVLSYLEMLDRLAEHDARDMLRHIDVPTLVIGGDRDPFTSRAAIERLVHGIAGAEYLLLPGATHFVMLDQAERVNLRIEKFWSERGLRGDNRVSAPPPQA